MKNLTSWIWNSCACGGCASVKMRTKKTMSSKNSSGRASSWIVSWLCQRRRGAVFLCSCFFLSLAMLGFFFSRRTAKIFFCCLDDKVHLESRSARSLGQVILLQLTMIHHPELDRLELPMARYRSCWLVTSEG